MIRVYFFGCLDRLNKGHYLYGADLRAVRGPEDRAIPFSYTICDGGLLSKPEEQGRLHLAHINGWTVLGMWDQTGDSRGNSNSSFIAEGIHDMPAMVEIAKTTFPTLWQRIKG